MSDHVHEQTLRLATMASLRGAGESREELISRFLGEALRETGVEDAAILLGGEVRRIVRLRDGIVSATAVPEQWIADPANPAELLPEGIDLAGRMIRVFPIEEAGFRHGTLYAGLTAAGAEAASRSLTLITRILSVALDNLSLLERAHDESRIDHLTGIGNYRSAVEQLHWETERARRFGRVFSVCLTDLDRFKELNDTLGHLAGNDALRAAASFLAGAVRRVDTVARYGGDEFLLILPNTGKGGALKMAHRLLDEMGEVDLGAGYTMSASIGVSVYPDDGESPELLLEAADRALYRAKGRGGGEVAA